MKTRTLLLLSVGVGLAILLAGGVFLFQLSTESAAVEPALIGEPVSVGDVELTVLDKTESAALLAIDVEIGGVDDTDGIDSFRLITGDRRLDPITAPTDGRCVEITVEFDEDRYAGTGVFLFAAVLERFLTLYASLNSATRLVARTRQSASPFKRWPFRIGDRTLL